MSLSPIVAGKTYRQTRTGVVFHVDETFMSAGERIFNATVVAGPHSVGSRFQSTDRAGDCLTREEVVVIDYGGRVAPSYVTVTQWEADRAKLFG
jgi:hypothetical protein